MMHAWSACTHRYGLPGTQCLFLPNLRFARMKLRIYPQYVMYWTINLYPVVS